jgi:hypothetical protein
MLFNVVHSIESKNLGMHSPQDILLHEITLFGFHCNNPLPSPPHAYGAFYTYFNNFSSPDITSLSPPTPPPYIFKITMPLNQLPPHHPNSFVL